MFQQRIQKIKQKLLEDKLDGVLVTDVANITYLTGYANFSKDEREAYLIITKNEQFIITDARYSAVIKRQVSHFNLLELSRENSLKNIFAKFKYLKALGIEENVLTVKEHKMLKKHFKKMKHMDTKLQRSIKISDEIKKIEQAAKLGDKAFEYILKKIKAGIAEKELLYELESFIKKNGADLSFPPIIAFGRNSAIPHHQTGETKLDKKEGQFILLDFGVKLENYCSDMTRTIFFGKPNEKQKKMYKTVLAAQQKVVAAIKSGELRVDKLFEIANKYIKSCGFPSIPHSLGHGIGLEVHEHPSLSSKSHNILKTGMVFSIEPGIYLPDFGGVRIEDLYVLEKTGLRQLTKAPKNLFFI